VEALEVLLEDGQLLVVGEVLEDIEALFLTEREVLVAVAVDDALRRVDDVLAVVAVLRERDLLAEQLEVARIDGAREVVHLVAGIVDVVLALDRIARCAQQVDESRAGSRAAAVADVQQARRVGADVLDLDLRMVKLWQIAERLPGLQDLLEGIVEHIALEVEVQEARPCDLRVIEPVSLDALGEFFGNLARIPMEDAGRLHGEVCRKVAELFRWRHLQDDLRQLAFRQSAFLDGIFSGLFNGPCQYVFDFQKCSSYSCAHIRHANSPAKVPEKLRGHGLLRSRYAGGSGSGRLR